MGNVVCVRCGVEALSKCPYCRNVFIDDTIKYGEMEDFRLDLLAMREIRQGRNEYGQLEGQDEFLISFSYSFSRDEKATNDQLMERLTHAWEMFNKVSLDDCKKIFCHHKWVFKPGEKSSIGCGHDKMQENGSL